jgi:hypothetical protein
MYFQTLDSWIIQEGEGNPVIYKIKPKPGCKYCNGSGEVVDWVDYGSTQVPLTSLCSCIEEQLPEEYDELRGDEIEIVMEERDGTFG